MLPIFYFDLASPEAYLSAERVLQTMPVATEWVPVLARGLPAPETFDAFRCAEERASVLEGFAATARARGLQPLRWPDPFPFDSGHAMHVATYAKQADTYRKLAAVQPNEPSNYLQLGQSEYLAGDTQAAITAWERFVKLAPDDPNAPLIKRELRRLRQTTQGAGD